MDHSRELVRRLCIDVYRNLDRIRVVACVCAFGTEAREARYFLCPTKRLEVSIENLVGRGTLRPLPVNLDFVGIFRRWDAVLLRQAWRDLRGVNAAMARVAS